MSDIFISLPESLVKKASLISIHNGNIELSNIITECFDYGAKLLYEDIIKDTYPSDTKDVPIAASISEVHNLANSIAQKFSNVLSDAESDKDVYYSEDDLPDSLGDAIITDDGSFEL